MAILFLSFLSTDSHAQIIKDPEIISEYLDTLKLTDDERRHLQQMYEMVGIRLDKIVGGEDADIADYPWHVALVTQAGSQYCGGSVIDAEWILTAAHCLGTTAFIRAGVTDRRDTNGQDRAGSLIIKHEDYVSVTQGMDIALIKLSEPLDLSDPNVEIIPISTQMHHALGFEDPDVMSTITGWGALWSGGPSSNILQVAHVPIVSNEQAQVGYPNETITDDMIAAGLWGVGGIDACQGDSGGPLFVPDPNSPVGYVVAGITSWGYGCAGATHMGMYARVSYFEDWIEEKSGLTFPGPGEDDGIPPATITDLDVSGLPSENSITLTWTAPGGSDMEGRAAFYDLRYSENPITAENFDDAPEVTGITRPAPVGTTELFSVSGLTPLTTYYFAIKARDFFGNTAEISNVVEQATDGSPQISPSAVQFMAELEVGETEDQIMTITNTGEGLLSFIFPSYMNTALTSQNAAPLKKSAETMHTAQHDIDLYEREMFHSYENGLIANPREHELQVIGSFLDMQADEHSNPSGLFNEGPSVLIEFEELTATGSEFFNVTGEGFTGELTEVRGDFILNAAGGSTWASDFAVLFTTEEEINTSTVVLQVGGYSDYGPSGTRINWGMGNSSTPGTPVNTTITLPTPLEIDGLYVWIGHGWSGGSASTWTGEIELIGVNDGPRFVTSIEPASGLIPVGESMEVAITFDATGLMEGVYESTTMLRSNDLGNPAIPIEFMLQTAGGEPILQAMQEELDFGNVFRNTTKQLPLTLINSGTAIVEVTGINVSNPAFTLDDDSTFLLTPGQSRNLKVTFAPTQSIGYEGEITFSGNNIDGDVIVTLSGTGTDVPSISVNPTIVEAILGLGSTGTAELQIQNTGDGPLDFIFPGFALERGIVKVDQKFLRKETIQMNITEEIEAQLLERLNASPETNDGAWNRNQNRSYDLQSSDNVVIEFDGFTASGGEFTLINDADYLGEMTAVIADFVLDAVSGGTWANDLAVLFTSSPEISTETVLLQVGGFTSFGPSGTRIPWGVGSGGTPGTVVNTTINLSTAFDMEDVYVWLGHGWITGGSSTWSGTIELVGVTDLPLFVVSVEPFSGTVEAGGSQSIVFTYDSEGYETGTFDADILIQSNDPANPEVGVTARMHVVMDGSFTVTPQHLDFGQVHLDEPVFKNITLNNQTTEDVNIQELVFTNPEFFSDYTSGVIASGESETISIGVLADGLGELTGSLSIINDSPDGNLSVTLEAMAVQHGILVLDPTEFTVTLTEGGSETLMFTITNEGDATFDFTVEGLLPETTDGEGILTFDPSSGSVAGGESVEVTAILNSTGLEPGSYELGILVSTDSPETPSGTITINLTVEEEETQSRMVTFLVNMEIMAQAGLFDPEVGDEVYVRGTFTDWGMEAEALMHQNGDLVYESQIELHGETGERHEYKYFLLAGDGRELPNNGWEGDHVGEEGSTNRILFLADEDMEMPVVFFNNMTDVSTENDTDVPVDWVLAQNYPNPFNPTTRIQYALPEASEVQLEVFNMAGQRVALLASGMQSAGYHFVDFDASRLSSGVYVYRLRTSHFTQTRKMLLVK